MLDLTENTEDKLKYDHLKAQIDFTVNRPFFFMVEVSLSKVLSSSPAIVVATATHDFFLALVALGNALIWYV